jgi:hypothetical protein
VPVVDIGGEVDRVTEFSRLAVDREQPRVEGPFEDHEAARGIVCGLAVGPSRYAAIGHLGVVVRAIDLWIVFPLLGAGPGIERDHGVERSRHI